MTWYFVLYIDHFSKMHINQNEIYCLILVPISIIKLIVFQQHIFITNTMTSAQNWPPPVKEFGAGSTFDKAAYAAYEAVKSERDALKEADVAQKKRVIALEQETADLLKSYQGIYDENKVLRSKLTHGPEAQRIKNFRSEINRLEEKVSVLRTQNEQLQDELESIQKHANQVSGEKKRIDDAFKMERELHTDKATTLQKENKSLLEKLEKLEHQQVEYETRINNYDMESDGLLNRYKQLKRDNLKMESKFKKQKDLMDEESQELKETNKEMAKEIIGLKTTLAKVQSDLHSTNLDYKAAQRQIEFQQKELDVFKTQSSQMKKNAKITNKEYLSMKEELQNVEDMLNDARNFGFEAILDEREHLKRKERKHLKRIDDLKNQVEELIDENNRMEVELNGCRKKMEAAITEADNHEYEVRSLKRRLEVLENANIELDRQGKYLFDNKRKSVHVTMDNLKLKGAEKEKSVFLAKRRNLEIQNRRLSRRVNELERDDTTGFEEITKLTNHEGKSSMQYGEIQPIAGYGPRSQGRKKNLRPTRSLPGF